MKDFTKNLKDKLIWVGALEDHPEVGGNDYTPIEVPKICCYEGTDALPQFDTEEECQTWCNNNTYESIMKNSNE